MIQGANTAISTYRLVDSGRTTIRTNSATIAQADAYLESVSNELTPVLGAQSGMEIFDCFVDPDDYRLNDLVVDDRGRKYYIVGIEKHEQNDDTEDLFALKLQKKTDQYNTAASVLFDGQSTNRIDVPYTLDLTTSDWSSLMIVKPTELIFRVLSGSNLVYSDTAFLAQKDGTGLGRTMMDVRIQIGGVLTGQTKFGSFINGFARDSSYNVQLNEWVYLGLTYNKLTQTLKMYVNGDLVGSFGGCVPEVATGNFVLGSHKSTTTNMMRGYMAQFRFFTQEVTAEEMKDWYDRFVRPNKTLAVEYLFRAGSGTFVEDTSGNGRHGTIGGPGVTWSPASPVIDYR